MIEPIAWQTVLEPAPGRPSARGPREAAPAADLEPDLGTPAGGVKSSPALQPLRPALKLILDTLPQGLRHYVTPAREQARRSREAVLPPQPTAAPELDRLLAGGLPRGALTELVGRGSSGRFSLVLTVLAASTGIGEATALVDLGDGLDPRTAAQAGVDLARLLWLRPRKLKEALLATEAVLACGFPCVVVDLGLPPLVGGKGSEGAWLRLARTAQERGSTLLLASPYRLSGPAATAVLELEGAHAGWQGTSRASSGRALLTELRTQLRLQKHRGNHLEAHAAAARARLRWDLYPPITSGLDAPAEAVEPARPSAPPPPRPPEAPRIDAAAAAALQAGRLLRGWRPRSVANLAVTAAQTSLAATARG